MQGPLADIIGHERQLGSGGADLDTLAQAHVFALAGGCLALGVRFAGSQDADLAAMLLGQLRYLLACKTLVPDGAAGKQ